MMRANRPFLILATPAFFLAVCGCSEDPRTTNPSKKGTENPAPSKTNTKPEALCRDNFLRLDQPLSEAELPEIFGPLQQESQESKDTKKYVWISGKTKLEVHVKNGKVVASWYPGEYEERGKRLAAYNAANSIFTLLREYVLKNKNRFPARPEDLDLTALGTARPDTLEKLKRGDVVVPWGKSANRLVWAYWKDTPQFGGPYVRFDSKSFHQCTPQEFARLDAIVLTADTIPADVVAEGKPGPGEPNSLYNEKKGVGFQGFFAAGILSRLLVSNPGSLDEVPKHLVRNYWDVLVLRQLEKGELIVRWGRDPKQGIYAYPRGFPGTLEESRWAIYKGQWAPFERIEEAKKALDE